MLTAHMSIEYGRAMPIIEGTFEAVMTALRELQDRSVSAYAVREAYTDDPSEDRKQAVVRAEAQHKAAYDDFLESLKALGLVPQPEGL